ncbi:MAG: amidohydrolase family protein [Chloroflexi bacterium]|nr:amidohydrolase family protein [Chloroflexota bacterium]
MDTIRIHPGHLIDGTGQPARHDWAVLIEGETIVAVGPDAGVPRPAHARHIDVPDGTALPGLIDAHVHLVLPRSHGSMLDEMQALSDDELVVLGAASAERFVRAGVTTVFDCGARGDTAFRIRDAVNKGLVLGPRTLVSGRPVTRTGGHCWWWGGEADGVEAVRAAVVKLLDEEGADGIKMMATGGYMTTTTNPAESAYPREVFEAAVEETHRRGRYITAHAHGVEGMRLASEAGIDCLQHASMIGPERNWQFNEEVARGMASRGTRAAMTMAQGIRVAREKGEVVDWRGAKRGDPLTAAMWMADARALADAGVELVVGTDMTSVVDTDHGEETILEIEAFVEIGFTPLQAIRAATSLAAANLKIDGITGTLAPGRSADILVVGGQPHRDIHDLRNGRAVLRAGRSVLPTPLQPPPLRLSPVD